MQKHWASLGKQYIHTLYIYIHIYTCLHAYIYIYGGMQALGFRTLVAEMMRTRRKRFLHPKPYHLRPDVIRNHSDTYMKAVLEIIVMEGPLKTHFLTSSEGDPNLKVNLHYGHSDGWEF